MEPLFICIYLRATDRHFCDTGIAHHSTSKLLKCDSVQTLITFWNSSLPIFAAWKASLVIFYFDRIVWTNIFVWKKISFLLVVVSFDETDFRSLFLAFLVRFLHGFFILSTSRKIFLDDHSRYYFLLMRDRFIISLLSFWFIKVRFFPRVALGVHVYLKSL